MLLIYFFSCRVVIRSTFAFSAYSAGVAVPQLDCDKLDSGVLLEVGVLTNIKVLVQALPSEGAVTVMELKGKVTFLVFYMLAFCLFGCLGLAFVSCRFFLFRLLFSITIANRRGRMAPPNPVFTNKYANGALVLRAALLAQS